MSRPRTPGLLTEYQVSCIRALSNTGASRRLVEYVEDLVAEHRADELEAASMLPIPDGPMNVKRWLRDRAARRRTDAHP